MVSMHQDLSTKKIGLKFVECNTTTRRSFLATMYSFRLLSEPCLHTKYDEISSQAFAQYYAKRYPTCITHGLKWFPPIWYNNVCSRDQLLLQLSKYYQLRIIKVKLILIFKHFAQQMCYFQRSFMTSNRIPHAEENFSYH